MENISKMKSNINDLINQDELLKTIIENNPTLSLIINKNLKILYANKTFYHHFGIRELALKNDLLGNVICCFNFENGKEICGATERCNNCFIRNTVEEAFKTGKNIFKREGSFVIISDSEVKELTLQISTSEVHYMDSIAIILYISDITLERTLIKEAQDSQIKYYNQSKELTELLKETEERYKEAVNIAHLGHWYYDILNDHLFWSDEIYKIFEIEPNTIELDFPTFLTLIHPEEKEIVKDEYNNSLLNKTPIELYHRIKFSDGRVKYILQKFINTYNEEGQAIHTFGMAMDVSESVCLQRELAEYSAALKEVNATKNKFFSIISHDLKSPFTSIIGFADLLMQVHSTISETEREEYIGYIKNAAKTTYDLLENLLIWSQSQTSNINIFNDFINLRKISENVVNLISTMANNKNISIKNKIDEDIIVYTDSNMLNTILQNLLTNSIKFTNEKGTIVIEAIINNKFVDISIIDNGIGMDEETKDSLFKTNKTQSKCGTNNERGTGLGLLICKEFIEKQCGQIWVESKLGKGSKFTFSIPLKL